MQQSDLSYKRPSSLRLQLNVCLPEFVQFVPYNIVDILIMIDTYL